MHVLVTGGAGFIGSHSVDCLLEHGARVRVFDNFCTGKRSNLTPHPCLEVVTGDIRDRQAVDEALDGITHVLHLAAQVAVPASVEAPLDSAAINVGGFLHVLDSARRHGIKRFVYASSSAAYGVPESLPVHEDAAAVPISPYGLEKKINDEYGALYRTLYGMATMGLRYFNVYGPRQDPASPYSGVISIFIQRLREERPLTVYGDGMQTRDFIFVQDVARANIAALQSTAAGVCNVATGRSVTLRELIEILAAITGRQPQVLQAQERAGDIRYSTADNTRLRTEMGVDAFMDMHAGLECLWLAGEPSSSRNFRAPCGGAFQRAPND